MSLGQVWATVFHSSCATAVLQHRRHLVGWHWLAVVSLGTSVGNGRSVITRHDEGHEAPRRHL